MQLLRQLVNRWTVWRADVQLHAAAVVSLCRENLYRTAVLGHNPTTPQPLPDSKPSSLSLLLQVKTTFHQYQSRLRHP
jgi:hypothetical protein